MKYVWNNFVSSFFRADVGVGQQSALSSILSALYITSIFHIFEKRTQNLLSLVFVFFLSFVDDSLFISLGKIFEKSNANLFCSYSIILSLFEQFSLWIKYNKLEVFYFSRLTKNFYLSPLDLESLGRPLHNPKDKWRYLRFIFNKKLSFQHLIYFYFNKALFTVKSIKLLGNLTRGLSPAYKWFLYRTYIMPIALYGFQLWYFKRASISYSLKELRKIQHRILSKN